jgi:hypothetical protein
MAALSALGVLRALCQAGADVARYLLRQGDGSNAVSLRVVKASQILHIHGKCFIFWCVLGLTFQH